MKIATIKTGLASLAMLPGLVMAAPAVADKADNAFMMICTALVLFMTIPGIAPEGSPENLVNHYHIGIPLL
ncbi:ammonia channel precursor (ammonia transporter) [Escherichia coli]|nr:ammonia channel precursor (ammonia transporter) [Escherichia coli]